MGLKYLNTTLASEAAGKSGQGFPVGWVLFGLVMVGLLVVGIRWARKHGRRS